MDLIQQQLLGWATKGLSPEKLKRARYDGVVLKVWRPVGDSNVWEEGRMVRDGLVLGFSSRVSENVQKGWIPLSDSTPVKRTSFSGRFGPSAESETEMPGFEIVCQDGEVAKCACSSEEEADEIVDKIVAWSKEKRPQMSSTAAKLRQKYNTSSPSVQGGNRSTVGLVVEGTSISAIVPGGPADKAFKGAKLDAHDKIVEVDGEKATSKSLPTLLKGDDVVGSTVTITVQKHNSKNTVSVRLVRAAAERIRAIGQLFLQLSEICSDCYHHKLPTVRDIEEAEEQARVINKLTAKHMEAHVAHIEELEEALARAERASAGDDDGGGGDAQDLRKCLERAEDQVMELAMKLRGAEEAGGSTSKELKESLKRAETAARAAERDRDVVAMEKKALEQELAASSTRARDTDTAVRRALEAEGRAMELGEQVYAKSKAEAEARVEGNALRERVVELERLLEESGKESAELAGKLAKAELDCRTAAGGAENAKREAKKIKEASEEREAAMSASLLQAEMGKADVSAQLSRAKQEVSSLMEEHEGVLRGKNASIEGYKSEIEMLKSQAQMAVGSETDKVKKLQELLQKEVADAKIRAEAMTREVNDARQASASDKAAYSEAMEKLERCGAEAKKHASEAAAARASVERIEYKLEEKEKLLVDERAIHKEIATELEAKIKASKEELRKTLKNLESDRVNSRRSSQHDQMEAARLQHECKNLQEQVEALTNQLREAKKEYRESVEESEKRLIEAERELSDKKIKAMVSEHSLSEYADTTKQLREQMAGSSAECARAVEEARVSKAALASSVEMVSEIENRVEELGAELNEKVGQLSRAETLQEELQEENERLKKAQAKSMVDEKAMAENAKLKADLAAMRAEHTKDVRSLGDEHEKEVESLKGDIKALGEQLAIARGEAAMLEEAQKPARHQLASLEQDLADALVIKGHLQVEVDQLEARCKELGESLERSEKEVGQLKRGVDDAKACVAALEKELAQVHSAALKREEAINSGAKSAQGKLEDALREAEGRVKAAEEKARELEGRAAAAEKASKAAKSLSDHARGEVQARMAEIEKQAETIKALEGKVAGGLEAEEAMNDELARERAASKALQEEKKALEKRSEEEIKALEKRSEEEKKALEKRSEEEIKTLEKRVEEEKKALEKRVEQLDKEVREGGERVKAVSSSAEELQGEVMGLAKLFEGTKKRSEEGLAGVSSKLGGRIKELEGKVAKGRKDAAVKLQDAEKRLSMAQGEVEELTKSVNALKETSGGSSKKVQELEERLKKADGVKTAAIATAEGAQGESKRLKERLLEMEAKYLGEVQNVQRLSKELGDAEDQCKVANAEAKGARADVKMHEQRMADLKSRIRELEAVVEKVQGEQLEGARRIKELLDERDRAASGAGAATDEATKLREKVTSLEEALASSKDDASDLEAKVARLEVELSTAERGIDLSISAGKELEARFTEEQKARSEAERLNDGHLQEIKVIKGLLEASRLEAKQAQEELAQSTASCRKLEEEAKESKRLIDKSKVDIEALLGKIAVFNGEGKKLQAKIEEVTRERDFLHAKDREQREQVRSIGAQRDQLIEDLAGANKAKFEACQRAEEMEEANTKIGDDLAKMRRRAESGEEIAKDLARKEVELNGERDKTARLEEEVANGVESEKAIRAELERERAASKASQEEKKALEKRSEEEIKALEKRVEQLDKEVREGGERVKAVSSSAEELQGEVMGLAKLFEGTKKRSEEGLAGVSSKLGGRIKELEGEVAKGRKDAEEVRGFLDKVGKSLEEEKQRHAAEMIEAETRLKGEQERFARERTAAERERQEEREKAEEYLKREKEENAKGIRAERDASQAAIKAEKETSFGAMTRANAQIEELSRKVEERLGVIQRAKELEEELGASKSEAKRLLNELERAKKNKDDAVSRLSALSDVDSKLKEVEADRDAIAREIVGLRARTDAAERARGDAEEQCRKSVEEQVRLKGLSDKSTSEADKHKKAEEAAGVALDKAWQELKLAKASHSKALDDAEERADKNAHKAASLSDRLDKAGRDAEEMGKRHEGKVQDLEKTHSAKVRDLEKAHSAKVQDLEKAHSATVKDLKTAQTELEKANSSKVKELEEAHSKRLEEEDKAHAETESRLSRKTAGLEAELGRVKAELTKAERRAASGEEIAKELARKEYELKEERQRCEARAREIETLGRRVDAAEKDVMSLASMQKAAADKAKAALEELGIKARNETSRLAQALSESKDALGDVEAKAKGLEEEEARLKAALEESDATVGELSENKADLLSRLADAEERAASLDAQKKAACSIQQVSKQVEDTEASLNRVFPERGLEGLASSLEGRLVLYYKKYNPGNVERAWVLAEQYRGCEHRLDELLSRTYGCDLAEFRPAMRGAASQRLINAMHQEESSDAANLLAHVLSISEQLGRGETLDALTLATQLLHGKPTGTDLTPSLLCSSFRDVHEERAAASSSWGGAAARASSGSRASTPRGSADDGYRVDRTVLRGWHDMVRIGLGMSPDPNQVTVAEAKKDKVPAGGPWERLVEVIQESVAKLERLQCELRRDVDYERRCEEELKQLRRRTNLLEQENHNLRLQKGGASSSSASRPESLASQPDGPLSVADRLSHGWGRFSMLSSSTPGAKMQSGNNWLNVGWGSKPVTAIDDDEMEYDLHHTAVPLVTEHALLKASAAAHTPPSTTSSGGTGQQWGSGLDLSGMGGGGAVNGRPKSKNVGGFNLFA